MEILIQEIYGKDFKDKDGKVTMQAQEIMMKLYGPDRLQRSDIDVNLKTFREFANQQQSIIFPAFKLHNALVEGIVGKSFWQKQQHKRYHNVVQMAQYKKLFEELQHSKGQKGFATDIDSDGEQDPKIARPKPSLSASKSASKSNLMQPSASQLLTLSNSNKKESMASIALGYEKSGYFSMPTSARSEEGTRRCDSSGILPMYCM